MVSSRDGYGPAKWQFILVCGLWTPTNHAFMITKMNHELFIGSFRNTWCLSLPLPTAPVAFLPFCATASTPAAILRGRGPCTEAARLRASCLSRWRWQQQVQWQEKVGRQWGLWKGLEVGAGGGVGEKQTRKFVTSQKDCWFGKVHVLQFGWTRTNRNQQISGFWQNSWFICCCCCSYLSLSSKSQATAFSLTSNLMISIDI